MAADGNDFIDGGTGVDTLTLAAGEAFTFNTSNARLTNVETITLGAATSVNVTGQTEAFTFVGGSGSETIVAGSNNDTINAGLGDDVITGAAGADVINGQGGNDTASYADVTGATSHGLADLFGIAVNLTDAAIDESGTNDAIEEILDTVGNNEDYELGQTGSTELEAGTAQYISDTKGDAYSIDTLVNVEGVIGSSLTDFIALGAGGMAADGGRGNDAIFGGNGADTMVGGLGDDVFFIANDSDHAAGEIITGGDGTDVIRFTSVEAGTLVLSANVTGVETVQITAAFVRAISTTDESIDASALTAGIALVGNDGANTLTGSAFADTFEAGPGDDRLIVDDLDTAVNGDAGTDTIVVAANTTFGILAADGLTQQLQNVEAAELASGVTLTVDNTDVFGPGIVAVTGVNDAATETLVVTGAAIGATAVLNFSAGAITLTNVVLNYQGGAGTDSVTGADLTADILSGGLGDDFLTVFLAGGEDTLTGGDGLDTFSVSLSDSTRDIVVITDYEVFVGTATVDTLDVVDITVATLSGVATVGVDTRVDLAPGAIVTRADGVTIESFEVSATGLVTLYNSNLAVGTIDEVYAESDADIYAIMEALTLLSGAPTAYTFEYDFNDDGTADGQIVASDDFAGITNIVQLVGVTGAELDAAADGIVLA